MGCPHYCVEHVGHTHHHAKITEEHYYRCDTPYATRNKRLAIGFVLLCYIVPDGKIAEVRQRQVDAAVAKQKAAMQSTESESSMETEIESVYESASE